MNSDLVVSYLLSTCHESFQFWHKPAQTATIKILFLMVHCFQLFDMRSSPSEAFCLRLTLPQSSFQLQIATAAYKTLMALLGDTHQQEALTGCLTSLPTGQSDALLYCGAPKCTFLLGTVML